MKCVKWTDKNGFNHASMIRDGDSDTLAPYGIPCDPPDLNQMDWEELKKELWNRLVDGNILTWADVQRQQTGLTGALRATFLQRLNTLYRTSPNGGDIKEAS